MEDGPPFSTWSEAALAREHPRSILAADVASSWCPGLASKSPGTQASQLASPALGLALQGTVPRSDDSKRHQKREEAMAKAAVRSKLECSVCLGLFKTPKFLPCHHTFCQKCLEDLASNSPTRRSFQCPTCRRDTAVPKGGVSTFQENFYLSDELEEVRKSTENERCALHRDQAVSLLCKDCDVPICQTCKTTRHGQHDTTSITDEIVAAKEELKLFLAELEERALAVEATLGKLSSEDKDAEMTTRELKNNIEEKANVWIAKLTAARDKALKSVNDFATKRQTETGQTILRCLKEQTKMKILREQAKSALHSGGSVIVLSARDKAKKLINNTLISRESEPAPLAMHDTRVDQVDAAIRSLSVHGFLSTPSGAVGFVNQTSPLVQDDLTSCGSPLPSQYVLSTHGIEVECASGVSSSLCGSIVDSSAFTDHFVKVADSPRESTESFYNNLSVKSEKSPVDVARDRQLHSSSGRCTNNTSCHDSRSDSCESSSFAVASHRQSSHEDMPVRVDKTDSSVKTNSSDREVLFSKLTSKVKEKKRNRDTLVSSELGSNAEFDKFIDYAN